jgi:hypothetical protein
MSEKIKKLIREFPGPRLNADLFLSFPEDEAEQYLKDAYERWETHGKYVYNEDKTLPPYEEYMRRSRSLHQAHMDSIEEKGRAEGERLRAIRAQTEPLSEDDKAFVFAQMDNLEQDLRKLLQRLMDKQRKEKEA